jgi:hypothetical protein
MRFFRLIPVILALVVGACSRKPASIEVSPQKVRIYGLERSQRLTARVLDKKGRPLEETVPSFSSSKPDVVTVDTAGRVVAKGEGKAMLTVSFQKVSSQLPVEVIDIKGIDVLPPSIHLMGPVGTQFPVQATAKNSKDKPVDIKATWTSSKPAVATVAAEGLVTSVSSGRTTLAARIGDIEAGCDVIVTIRDVARLEVRPATAIVHAGDSQKFDVLGYGTDGKLIEGLNAVFQSSDAAVAKVDPVGTATGLAAGAATIRASIGPVRAEATLIVN